MRGRATGGVGAEEEADQDGGAEGEHDRVGRDHRLDPRDREVAADDPGHHPRQPAEQRDEHGLDQELDEDVRAPGADRLADADLPGALGDRDEHDVHHADPADQQ